MQKLFVSFTSLLRLVGEGKVSPSDLAQGLFFFSCQRRHALNPGAAGEYDERTHAKNSGQAHPAIVEAVLQAEQDGRAAWHNRPNSAGRSPWRVLDELLVSNGHKALHHTPGLSWDYGYPAVRDEVAARTLALDVVY